jgi:hypothetical protein
MRGPWVAGLILALTVGTAYLWSTVARADAGGAGALVLLELASQPVGAGVWVDGRQRGATPTQVAVEPGVHRVLLKRSDTLDRESALQVGAGGAALDAVLWRRQPSVTRLRPALPGAALADVRLLEDGELALSMSLPPGPELEAWRLDPHTGTLRSILRSVAGARLALAADGHHLAYLGPDIGPPASPAARAFASGGLPPARVAWLVDATGPFAAPAGGWRAPLDAGEELVDVSWSPHAERLLVTSRQPLPEGGARSRAWLVTADGQRAEATLSLPSDIVPGTALWSPDGQHVAFVAHAGQVNALCLLGLDGAFRYVADLEPSAAPPLGYPRVTWSADGQRLLFVAPRQHPPGVAFDWLRPDSQRAVYQVWVDQPVPDALIETQVDQVTWREDGQLVGLGRSGTDDPLSIRLLNSAGGLGDDLLDLPLKPGAQYAGIWDVPRARVLVASRGAAAANDYWLVRLAAEDY